MVRIVITVIGWALLDHLALLPQAAAKDDLIVYYEDHPPFTYPEDGAPKGMFVAATENALREAGFAATWHLMSFNRIRRALTSGREAFCVTGHGKGSEGDGRQYILPAIGTFGRSGLLIREADRSKFAQVSSVRALFEETKLVGGFVRDAIYAVPYQQYLPRSHGNHLMAVGTHEQLAQLVAKGRVDFVFENEMMVPLHQNLNKDGDKLAFVTLPGMPEAREAYIVCSKNVPEEWVTRLGEGVRRIKKAAQ